MSKAGLIEGARFSWNCRPDDRVFCDGLYGFVGGNGGKSDGWIENCLRQLYSFFYYLLIAQQNGIDDPFALEVVQAHWIGNDLLHLPTRKDIQKVLASKEFEVFPAEKTRMMRVLLLSLLKTEAVPHHSFHAAIYERLVPSSVRQGKRCFVECGQAKELRDNSFILQLDDEQKECGYGFMKQRIQLGDCVLIHLNEARRLATEEEKIRLADYTSANKCTLRF